MIRIDEIYNNTFWPWLQANRPGMRMFYCDPPGHTHPDALFNHGSDQIKETDYVFFHDQEPIHLDAFEPLFKEVKRRNTDVWWQEYSGQEPDRFGHVVVSEQGEYTRQLSQTYGWQVHYYFYHAWAALDWYRGYDRTFLIDRARNRQPTRTFISPNRIVAGRRDHRVLFLYNIFRHQLEHNHISAPRICQYEQQPITTIAEKYTGIYPDIQQTFAQAQLPRLFAGENEQIMSSCWLTNFAEAADSLVYVPTETVYFGHRTHITEKTFKAIALEMPFVLVAPHHSLEYLKQYGFRTFSTIFDESYDEETDDIVRIEKVTRLLKDLDNLTTKERQTIHRHLTPIVEHNYNHFYSGSLATNYLWPELINMLDNIKQNHWPS